MGNVPFLRMKAKYLQQELSRAQREYEQSKVELDIFINHQNYDQFLNRLKSLEEQKNRKNKAPSSPTTAPVLKAKQNLFSSKDLPLIQEQKEKEVIKKKQEEENIETFKPIGGLNDGFFADLGDDDDIFNNEEDEDNDDLKDDDFELNEKKDTKPIHSMIKKIKTKISTDDDDDNEKDDDQEGIQ